MTASASVSAPSLQLSRIGQIAITARDLPRAIAFYRDVLGMPFLFEAPKMAFFDCGGTVLSLYGRDDLARDCGRPVGAPDGQMLAHNVASAEAVAAAVASFLAAGGTLVKAPLTAHWGGTIAFVADPDGHVWEIAHNPFWPIDATGRVSLPPPA